MIIILELDGPVLDLRPVYYAVYREVAAEVGWSRLEESAYWRAIRTRGREAVVLPGAKPIKIEKFWNRFDQLLEQNEVVARYKTHPGIEGVLEEILRHGRCCMITTGSNIAARSTLLARMKLAEGSIGLNGLSSDPRRRPGELRALGGSDRRVIVAAGTDAVVRSAAQAELISVGISSGSSSPDRLRRAGADVVYPGLDRLVGSLQSGAADLIQAGLLPPPLG